VFVSWLYLVVAMAAHCVGQESPARIRIKGSDTMLYLNESWADAYHAANSNVKIEVTGGGSELGVKAMLSGDTELAATSRPIKSMERETLVKAFGELPKEFAVGLDGIGIYVNPANPIQKLTMEQVNRIFSGSVREWDEIYPFDAAVEVYSRNRDSGTHTFFVEHVLAGREVGEDVRMVANTAVLIEFVKRSPGAIGYGGLGYSEGVRALALESAGGRAIPPTVATISDGTYPISRTLYLYVAPNAWTPAVKQFITWVLGTDGQKFVAEHNYIPLPEERIAAVKAQLAGR
jgi:phosphate transport system substrate-binding protein